ncbi:hypothetical protein IAR55_005387 [Kwoniella newhampshirensis]|uniref:SMP-30/Gluconolactonase/LRE-like region domain-containing protein n=1 Tax=Kwoniella newhampshirensis TaxID=1651941 RepID=A0AAW0YW94_9TREE
MSTSASSTRKRTTRTAGTPQQRQVSPRTSSSLSWARWATLYLPPLVGLAAYAIYTYTQNSDPISSTSEARDLPPNAQKIDPKSFTVLDSVPPPYVVNGSSFFVPPGMNEESLKARPFHIYHESFYDIIGPDPSLTLIAETEKDPLFHEAAVWYPPTDEFFFCQNAGAPAAGTGLHKSAIVEKISLAQAEEVVEGKRKEVDVISVEGDVKVINPNGGTNFRGKIVLAGEGQGDHNPSALYLVDPVEPYKTTVILNNYHGRQFNSLNDIAVNPRNKQLYFTDPTYGHVQHFRPTPGLPNQVYRFDVDSGAVGVVADGLHMPNGITFSPDGYHAYISDTGISMGFWGKNHTRPSTIYRYDVNADGTWNNRRTFAFVEVGFADGIHTDTAGNLYAGCGDGISVWNPSGILIGKIFVGHLSANFQFAGKGRMVILAETRLYYVKLGAEGAKITDKNYSER